MEARGVDCSHHELSSVSYCEALRTARGGIRYIRYSEAIRTVRHSRYMLSHAVTCRHMPSHAVTCRYIRYCEALRTARLGQG